MPARLAEFLSVPSCSFHLLITIHYDSNYITRRGNSSVYIVRASLQLDKTGHTSAAPALPSLGSTPPAPNCFNGAEVIRETVTKLIQDHDVVVVNHSFSGMTGGTALEGLGKETSSSKGLKGGVIRPVCITTFLAPEGFQHSPRGTRDNMIPEMKTARS